MIRGVTKSSVPYTVSICLSEYLGWMQKSAVDARYRANALIIPQLGAERCDFLTAEKIRQWLESMARDAARIRMRKLEQQKFKAASNDPDLRRRRRASANRTLTILKAALNRAWRAGKIASDNPWRRVEPFEDADAARVRNLTIAEAQRFINASHPDFRALTRVALATGARYGELASLLVADFNPDSKTLHVSTSKSGKGRHIFLTDEGAKLFASWSAGRPPAAALLQKNGGGKWSASHQTRPMLNACVRAPISPPANFHCLRHTYASHSIVNGAPLLIVAKNLGHSDTRMVEKRYGHLAQSYVADAIRTAAPQFAVETEDDVVPFVASRQVQSLFGNHRPAGAIVGATRAMRDVTGNLPPFPGICPDYSADRAKCT
jgi:integrase